MDNAGIRIRALLKEKNMTQKQLAKLTGVTESALSHYVKGDRIPSGDALANIAYALSTTANYILGKEDVLDFSNVKRILARNKNEMTNQEKAELIDLLFGKD
ncbi:MAG TPA: XRE family transcriptional regulator [Catenibacterium sp.]|nr:XRE family transcriptional regulator [Catenibacterium sp.]